MGNCHNSVNGWRRATVEPVASQSPTTWRSLEELEHDPDVLNAIEREFPTMLDRMVDLSSRREFLRVMGASLALAGVSGCMRQPEEQIVPYVRAPEHQIPGQREYYATAMTHAGACTGLLVESHMGRPVKVEGNPLHPAVPEVMARANKQAPTESIRFGATDAFAQSIVLSLYDPDRSQTVLRNGQIDTWETFFTELRKQLEHFDATGGRGLHLLTETVISPTLVDQLQQLQAKYPNAAWHQFEAVNDDNAIAGAQIAFGTNLVPEYDLTKADVILCLDSDFLAEGPLHLTNARQFAERRKALSANPSMNRLYSLETSRTLTGASADHRLTVGPRGVLSFAVAVAAGLGVDVPVNVGGTEVIPRTWVDAVLDDLGKSRGRSLVLAGCGQPPAVHAIAHWLNTSLGNISQTIFFHKPIAASADSQVDSLRALVNAMSGGAVEALVLLGGNPAYDTPSDLKFMEALKKVPFTVHLSEYANETSAMCTWHVPRSHLLETWSDTRAADGTLSIVQPLISPLYKSKTDHEVLGALLGNPVAASHDLVHDFWRRQHGAEKNADSFDAVWQKWLHDGIAPNSALPNVSPSMRSDFATALNDALKSSTEPTMANRLQIAFRPDPSLWDGRFANNGWLQELPRPFTKLTWDNAALVGPNRAKERQLTTGDVVELQANGVSVEIPVIIVPGHPNETITLHLGYGRTNAGRVGNDIGVNVYPLRASGSMWFAAIDELRKTGEKYSFAITQHHHLMQGRNLVRAGTLNELQENPQRPSFMKTDADTNPQNSLFPAWQHDGYQWGLVVNQSSCIGCNACVVACQAENNIPVVGKEQVSRGREMHWLRIDNYYEGEVATPTTYHQPVLCMHCETAPCEIVCPVGATTHSNEGLNEMTYNRCVGTRYCSNNCPYKVRRFNFYDFNAELRQDATMQLRPNPDVTVRSAGVMEKCTYCVQRINEARIDSEKEGRTIRDGEIVTACQSACPTEALTFGNLNNRDSEVSRLAATSLNYSLLGELNTRPRTTYLAVVRNPHPTLAKTSENATS